jgi:hypothetical protein
MVATSFKANVPEPNIPASSLYLPVKSNIAAIARGDMVKNPTPSDAYAEMVINDVLGGRSGQVWRGASAGLAKVGKMLFPVWLRVSFWLGWRCGVGDVLTLWVGSTFDGRVGVGGVGGGEEVELWMVRRIICIVLVAFTANLALFSQIDSSVLVAKRASANQITECIVTAKTIRGSSTIKPVLTPS